MFRDLIEISFGDSTFLDTYVSLLRLSSKAFGDVEKLSLTEISSSVNSAMSILESSPVKAQPTAIFSQLTFVLPNVVLDYFGVNDLNQFERFLLKSITEEFLIGVLTIEIAYIKFEEVIVTFSDVDDFFDNRLRMVLDVVVKMRHVFSSALNNGTMQNILTGILTDAFDSRSEEYLDALSVLRSNIYEYRVGLPSDLPETGPNKKSGGTDSGTPLSTPNSLPSSFLFAPTTPSPATSQAPDFFPSGAAPLSVSPSTRPSATPTETGSPTSPSQSPTTCDDDETYSSRHGLDCLVFSHTVCGRMDNVGFSVQELAELIDRCKKSCGYCPSDPSGSPSGVPFASPSFYPSSRLSFQPSLKPSSRPSLRPSLQPSPEPVRRPSPHPSFHPSLQPSFLPTPDQTFLPTHHPSPRQSHEPSNVPTTNPLLLHISDPSPTPSSGPARANTTNPTPTLPAAFFRGAAGVEIPLDHTNRSKGSAMLNTLIGAVCLIGLGAVGLIFWKKSAPESFYFLFPSLGVSKSFQWKPSLGALKSFPWKLSILRKTFGFRSPCDDEREDDIVGQFKIVSAQNDMGGTTSKSTDSEKLVVDDADQHKAVTFEDNNSNCSSIKNENEVVADNADVPVRKINVSKLKVLTKLTIKPTMTDWVDSSAEFTDVLSIVDDDTLDYSQFSQGGTLDDGFSTNFDMDDDNDMTVDSAGPSAFEDDSSDRETISKGDGGESLQSSFDDDTAFETDGGSFATSTADTATYSAASTAASTSVFFGGQPSLWRASMNRWTA
eukprot:CAMPEP_0194301276 /NCGR_PEP_ID=MMETSP0169-20130528/61706_1 /TAXON_ID=218684 /ORGANISM="Corethron pennatum, Strain L29A3" /LENGTH=773 /DNA_ID=CAMNT_0039051507 /DNA_START=578 /DNA_END=2899 /DNA_ORIENTATION=-